MEVLVLTYFILGLLPKGVACSEYHAGLRPRTFKQFYSWIGLTELTSYIIKSSFTKQNVRLHNKSFQCTCIELKTHHLKLTRRNTVNGETTFVGTNSPALLTFGIQYFLLCSPHCTVWESWQPMLHLCTTHINIRVTPDRFLVLSVQ